MDKYKELSERSESCLKRHKKHFESSEFYEIEREISDESARVEDLKKLVKYFQSIHSILLEERVNEEFKENLLRQKWKESLENLANLINNAEGSSSNDLNITKLSNDLIEKRLNLFNSVLEKKIKTYIDGLGWPKIVSNDETVEIISRLQELLTYGEALYILSGSVSIQDHLVIEHPIKHFIEPIRVRFDYHFNSDKPTNQIDRPEWYFDHLIGITRSTVNFLREFVFPCWRLRDLDSFLREGIIKLAEDKTIDRLNYLKDNQDAEEGDNQGLLIHHLIEFGKFLRILRDEFGCLCDEEGIIEKVFTSSDSAGFVERELERIQSDYKAVYCESDTWMPDFKNVQMGEPSSIVLKFLSFFHSKTILPYSFLRKDLKLRSELLTKVQTWLLESFHDKCQFECSPLHNDKESILKDIGMINSMLTLCKVLQDDFGESLVRRRLVL